MTPQEIFDRTVRHLASQGGPATTGCRCAYRGVNGRKCAVGMWMPDELYSPMAEGNAVLDTLGSPKVVSCLPEDMRDRKTLRLLGFLQQAHDSSTNHDGETWRTENFVHSLKNIARSRKLRVKVINEVFPK